MKSSTISDSNGLKPVSKVTPVPGLALSNSLILSAREWIITLILVALVSAPVYFGWFEWERFAPGKDYRVTCWAERESDYWAFARWSRYARDKYDILLIGDSVIWGQETTTGETFSHYLNEGLGGEMIANIGIDGLHMAGIHGMVKHYGRSLKGKNIILQLNPLWISSEKRDLRGEGKISYHHPRLLPQLSRRINYNQPLDVRVGYLFDHYLRLPIFVRHLMVNYYNNKSIADWMLDNPYKNPFAAITFEATPVMAEGQGRGIDWQAKNMEVSDSKFVPPGESMQLECYFSALKRLKKMNANVFVHIGPFNTYALTPESRENLKTVLAGIKRQLDIEGVLYFDSTLNNLPSETFGDTCHLLSRGHEMLAGNILASDSFKLWVGEIKNP
ncbi:hypothetical protein ACFL2X_03385 [Candidatus Latescibacterota bacterium]